MGQRRVTSERLLDYFHQRTGDTLEVQAASPELPGFSPPFELLALADESTNIYGSFRIDVYRDSHDLMRDQQMLVDARPESNGIYWTWLPSELDNVPSHWSASKRYGNVLLTWFNDKKATDPGWDRLDSILTDLIRSEHR